MKRFRNILVYANGGDGGLSAVRRAAAMGAPDEAQVTVVDILPELPASMKGLQTVMPFAEVESIAREEAVRRLEDLIKSVKTPPGFRATAKVLIGKPFLQIIRQVLIQRHDLVIKTAEQPGGLSNRLFGSTGRHLLRKCPCAVLIVKADTAAQFDRILAAVDISATEESEQRLNHDIVETALAQARDADAELHVVTAAELWMDSSLSMTDKSTAQDLNRIAKERATEAKVSLDRLVKAVVEDHRVTTHLLQGTPGAMVPRLAAELQADLLVLGTVGRTGLSGFFMGNTSEEILEHVNCAVLALKPPGYDTPVRISQQDTA